MSKNIHILFLILSSFTVSNPLTTKTNQQITENEVIEHFNHYYSNSNEIDYIEVDLTIYNLYCEKPGTYHAFITYYENNNEYQTVIEIIVEEESLSRKIMIAIIILISLFILIYFIKLVNK